MLVPLTAADGETILSLEDAKTHLNLTDSDTLYIDKIPAWRAEAIQWVEQYAGQSLQSRDFGWSVDRFTSRIRLPIGPVSAVSVVRYYDSTGTDISLDSGNWQFGNDVLASATGKMWPLVQCSPGGVRITFTAGYADVATEAPYLLAAVKLHMTANKDNPANPDLTGAMRCADQFRAVLV